MWLRKHTWLFALFALSLAFNAWVYASLAQEPDIGPALASSARASSPLLHTYVVLGRPLAARAGDAGQSIANAAYGNAYKAMSTMPAAAGSLLFSESRGALRALLVALYWATPVLLLLALLAWALRSRNAHLMGRPHR